MKLSAVLFGLAVAADGDDRHYGYDPSYGGSYGGSHAGAYGSYDHYHIPYGGKVGHAVSGVVGGHQGNRRFCHSTLDTVKIYRWDASVNGYWAHFNPVECIGEEIFCMIEERAHFGQVIGIRAGCAQMMNHPQVSTVATPLTHAAELKNHYNQEAARGATFQQTTNSVVIYYGIGGCLALPAQNGYDAHSSDFRTSLLNNYYEGPSPGYPHAGYGMDQCLRQQRTNAKAQLLPFGVSVCRTCCLANNAYYGHNGGSNDGPCNFWPFGSGGLPTAGHITQTTFGCNVADATSGCTFDASVASASTCTICSKEMFPNFSMYTQPDYNSFVNVFQVDVGGSPFCSASACTPVNTWTTSNVKAPDNAQPIVGG